jgi:cytochrome c553
MKNTAVASSVKQIGVTLSLTISLTLVAILALIPSSSLLAQGDADAGAGKIAVCVACHGQDGNMIVLPNVPKIGGQNEKYLLKQMQDIKSGVRAAPLMTGMLNALNDQDLVDVAAYFASLPMSQGATLYSAGNASIGVAACSACHSPDGRGLASAGYPSLSGQDIAYTELQLKAFRDGVRQNDEAEVMRSIVARLNDAEIAALASYVAGLR